MAAIGAIVAATARTRQPPTVLLTSHPDDMNKLVGEPSRPKLAQIAVVRV